jgi:nucleotide-binding universal stress UspA family protein
MYKRILLAYDGSAAGQQALLDCHEIAQWSHAELTLIAVMPLPLASVGTEGLVYAGAVEEGEKARYQTILETGVRKLADAGLRVRGEVVVGDAVREIAHCAHRIGADLIMVGHQHLSSWTARWWRSSVSKALIEQAPCSVLVVITQ